MSNLGQMRSEALNRMALSSGSMFSDAEINTALQREYENLQVLAGEKNEEYFAKQVTFISAGTGLSTGTTAYQLPLDFINIISLEVSTNNIYQLLSRLSAVRRTSFLGAPTNLQSEIQLTGYYLIGKNIYLIPDIAAPTNGQDNLKLIYLYSPVPMAADVDVPELPAQYHETIVIGAVNRLRSSLKEPPIDKQLYDEQRMQFSETISPRIKATPKQVRIVPGGFY